MWCYCSYGKFSEILHFLPCNLTLLENFYKIWRNVKHAFLWCISMFKYLKILSCWVPGKTFISLVIIILCLVKQHFLLTFNSDFWYLDTYHTGISFCLTSIATGVRLNWLLVGEAVLHGYIQTSMYLQRCNVLYLPSSQNTKQY